MFKIFIFSLLLVFSIGGASFAGTQAYTKNAETDLNKASPGSMQKYQLGSLVTTGKVWIQKGVYDYSVMSKVSGGTSGSVNLRDPYSTTLKLPKGAIVTDCLIDVISAPTGHASATIALSTGKGAGDLKAATALSGFASGSVACVPVGTAATSIKMTSDSTPTIKIVPWGNSGGAITGLKLNTLIQYILSDP